MLGTSVHRVSNLHFLGFGLLYQFRHSTTKLPLLAHLIHSLYLRNHSPSIRLMPPTVSCSFSPSNSSISSYSSINRISNYSASTTPLAHKKASSQNRKDKEKRQKNEAKTKKKPRNEDITQLVNSQIIDLPFRSSQ